MAIQRADLDQSHDWDDDTEGAPEPHSSGFFCQVCSCYVCMFCTPDQNESFDVATTTCSGKPWYE